MECSLVPNKAFTVLVLLCKSLEVSSSAPTSVTFQHPSASIQELLLQQSLLTIYASENFMWSLLHLNLHSTLHLLVNPSKCFATKTSSMVNAFCFLFKKPCLPQFTQVSIKSHFWQPGKKSARKNTVKWGAARSLPRRGSGHNCQDFIDHLVKGFSQCIDGDGMFGMFNEIFL